MISMICGGLESSIMAEFKFENYESLGRYIHTEIINWICNGNMEDVDFDIVVSALDSMDRLVEEEEDLYSNINDLGYMFIIAESNVRFKTLFNTARPPVLTIHNAACMVMTVWKFMFRDIFSEYYSEFKDLQEKGR